MIQGLDVQTKRENVMLLATNEVFIQSFYVLHIKSIVLILCSHIYEYLPMGIDSTVFQYLILYPVLVGKVKTHKPFPNIWELTAQQGEEEKYL